MVDELTTKNEGDSASYEAELAAFVNTPESKSPEEEIRKYLKALIADLKRQEVSGAYSGEPVADRMQQQLDNGELEALMEEQAKQYLERAKTFIDRMINGQSPSLQLDRKFLNEDLDTGILYKTAVKLLKEESGGQSVKQMLETPQ